MPSRLSQHLLLGVLDGISHCGLLQPLQLDSFGRALISHNIAPWGPHHRWMPSLAWLAVGEKNNTQNYTKTDTPGVVWISQ